METTHTFGIDLLIRKCKYNKKQGFIYARITVDEERVEISTKEKIDVATWDPDKEIVKGKTIEVKEINQHLDDIRHKIKSKYRMLKESESLITAEKVKEAYEGILACQKGHTLAELTAYYKKIWESKMKIGGFKNYKTTIDYLTKYYGFDLAKELAKHPIKELASKQDKAKLMESLQRGNRQAVTFIKEGTEQRMFIEANPRFKSLNIYDSSMQRVHSQSQKEKNAPEQSVKQETKKESRKQGADEGEDFDQPKQKRNRRKGQSIS
jgi:hypothetical protein